MGKVNVYKTKENKEKLYSIHIEFEHKEKGNIPFWLSGNSLKKSVAKLKESINTYLTHNQDAWDYKVCYKKPYDCLFDAKTNKPMTTAKNLNFLERKIFEFYLNKQLKEDRKNLKEKK
jgi:hypothetical protein